MQSQSKILETDISTYKFWGDTIQPVTERLSSGCALIVELKLATWAKQRTILDVKPSRAKTQKYQMPVTFRE